MDKQTMSANGPHSNTASQPAVCGTSDVLRDRLELAATGLMSILDPEKDLMPTRGYEVAHDLGRWWDAALRLEETIGFVIPAELEAAALRNPKRFTDNPDRLLPLLPTRRSLARLAWSSTCGLIES
jgi:hypothetical protein